MIGWWKTGMDCRMSSFSIFTTFSPIQMPTIGSSMGKFNTSSLGKNTLAYPSSDDHPSKKGSQKATEEFIPLLNIYVNRWLSGASPAVVPGYSTELAPPNEEMPLPSEPERNSPTAKKFLPCLSIVFLPVFVLVTVFSKRKK